MSKKTRLKKSTHIDPVSRVRIIGEGHDENGNRYVKLGIRETSTTLGPYSMKELVKSRDRLFTDLSNAGVSFLTTKAQRGLLDLMQNRIPGPNNIKVATRLGWHGSAFVLPSQIFGKAKQLETAFGDVDSQMLRKYRMRGDAGAERFARAALAGEVGGSQPWSELLSSVRARGDATKVELDALANDEIELYPKKERKRIEPNGQIARAVPGGGPRRLRSISPVARLPVVRRPDQPGRRRRRARPPHRSAERVEADAGRGLDSCAPRSSWSRTPGSGSSSTSPRTWRARRSPIGWSARSGRERRGPSVDRVYSVARALGRR